MTCSIVYSSSTIARYTYGTRTNIPIVSLKHFMHKHCFVLQRFNVVFDEKLSYLAS